MRVFLIVAGEAAILLLETEPPEDCDESAERARVEVIPSEPRDTIPCPPPEFDSFPDGTELFNLLCALAWHRAPAGQA
jgi:hypothetical protein